MDGKRGTILITTLWILALLTLLAVGIGTRIGIDIKLIGFSLNGLKAHYIAKAGILKAMVLIEEDGSGPLDSLNEKWSSGYDSDEEEYLLKEIPLGEGSFCVSYEFGQDEEGKAIRMYGASDEGAKININTASPDMLSLLPGFSSEIVAAVMDWRDEDTSESDYLGARGTEDSYYKEELENPYDCKDAPFSVKEELLLVKGVTDDVYEGVKDLITVYGEDSKININTVCVDVLNALIGQGETDERGSKIIKERNGFDDLPGTEDDNVIRDIKELAAKYTLSEDQMKYFKMNTDIFRIHSLGQVRDGKVKKTVEVVVKRIDRDKTEILFYYED
ncbi:MAG: general secretion pathway protein GspK [Candidatus Omnitrophica bacterium]|nr:general secretion pathway protein GspK [Candidatus Omnitrophota bacterium]